MYALPFADGAFDTIILDDFLADAERPTVALAEALRLLRPGGRILLLAAVNDDGIEVLRDNLAAWAAATGLRLAAPRPIPGKNPNWLLAVATRAAAAIEAA
jgi:ArsR family transcriptional regulator